MNKKLKVLAVPVLGLLALTSCGGSNEPVIEGKASISVWTGFGDTMSGSFEDTLSSFMSANDNIEVTHTTQGGYDNLLSAITGSVSTSTYPNVAVAYPDHMAQYNESSILFNLTSSIKSLGINLDDYYQNYLQENQEIVDGATMGLPFNKSTEVLTTNSTFVNILVKMTESKSGDDKITGVPTTWQEVEKFGLAARKVLTETGAFGKVIGADGKVYADALACESAGTTLAVNLTAVDSATFKVLSYDSQANFFITMVRQWGGTYTSIVNENGKRKGYMHYKSSETVSMLKFFNRLFREGIIGIPASFGETSYTSTPFKAEKTIFTVGSSAGVTNCVDTSKEYLKVEINALPYNAEKEDCKYVISQGTNLVMFKNADSNSRAASLKLIKYLSYDETANATFAKESGYLPVTKQAYNSTVYQSYLTDTTLNATQASKRDAAKVNFEQYQGSGKGWTQYVDPGFVGSSSIRSNISGVMAECKDVSEADASKDSTWTEMLDRYYALNENNIPND